MDAALLITREFWCDAAPWSAQWPVDPPRDAALRGTVWFRTSGSSGTPKWVVLTKSALLASAEAVNDHLAVEADACWGLALPVHHVGGFGVAARAYVAGCRLAVFQGRWNAARFSEWLAAERVTHLSLVPAQVHDLVRAGMKAPPELRVVEVGGGALDPVQGRAARALGWPVLASFGMTESASQIATQALDALDREYRCAPIPLLPIWRCALSETGCLRLAGPALCSGWLEEQEGGMRYTRRTGDWYETADRVMLADEGLTPLGRADLCVKILGELVDLESVERELAELAGGVLSVGDFAVAAIEDARAGSLLVPVFVRGVDAAHVERVIDEHRRMVPGFRRLGQPVWVDTLPTSELGKLRRGELARIAADAKQSA